MSRAKILCFVRRRTGAIVIDPMAWLSAVCSGTAPLCTSSRSLVECLAMIFCWLAVMRATPCRPCLSSRPRTRPAAAAPLAR
eukprot:2065108-Pyramimonas_sp.AAC.1